MWEKFPEDVVEVHCVSCCYKGSSVPLVLNGKESVMFECRCLHDEQGERIWVKPWDFCSFGETDKR